MKLDDLSQIGAGFAQPSWDSQRTFRTCLDALSRPGTVHRLDALAETPVGADPAAALLLLALLDADTRLWLSPALVSIRAGSWLRFHTGCVLVDTPAQADFVWVSRLDELVNLSSLLIGSPEYPDRSATCLLELPGQEGEGSVPLLRPDDASGTCWRLEGPGLKQARRLFLSGVATDFSDRFSLQWRKNQDSFPCGVDVILTAARDFLALPRTTQITQEH